MVRKNVWTGPVRNLCLFLCLLGSLQLSAAVDESFARANQKMAEATVYEVVEIMNWNDCDMPPARTFRLNDGSSWFAITVKAPLYPLAVGQRVVIIPMTDAEIPKYRSFRGQPHWIILHPHEGVMSIKIAHKW